MGTKVQEIETLLVEATNSYQTAVLLNELASEVYNTAPERAITLTKQAIDLANQDIFAIEQRHEVLGHGYLQMSHAYLRLAHYQDTLSLAAKASWHFQQVPNQRGQVFAQNSLGLAHLYTSNYPDALNHFLRAREIAQANGERDAEAMVLNNLGYLYILLGEPAKALSYLELCEKACLDSKQAAFLADALDNMGNAYRQSGNLLAAIARHQQSYETWQVVGDKRGETESLISLGDDHLAAGDQTLADAFYNQALQGAKVHHLLYQMLIVLMKIGELCRLQGQRETAVAHLHMALDIAQTLNANRELFLGHQILAEVYKTSGDFEKALAHYEQFHTLEKTVFNEEADKRLKNLEVTYQVETERQKAEIYQLKNIALQREISERERAELALRTANQQLQHEVAVREELIAELDAFAHTIAHDLKGPLSLITGFSEVMVMTLEPLLTKEQMHYLFVIERNGRKLATLVDELLLLATLRQEEIESHPVDMTRLISEAEEQLFNVIQESKAQIIKPDIWPVALGYAPWLEEVWSNYMSNAIKYGGTPPVLMLGATLETNGFLRFWVQDNGNGIPPEEQSQLFTTFTRLDRTRATGHGLGLSIVKRIIEKLGGTVGVESSGLPGQGSRFWFMLPGIPD